MNGVGGDDFVYFSSKRSKNIHFFLSVIISKSLKGYATINIYPIIFLTLNDEIILIVGSKIILYVSIRDCIVCKGLNIGQTA